jgi:hypothetical protein
LRFQISGSLREKQADGHDDVDLAAGLLQFGERTFDMLLNNDVAAGSNDNTEEFKEPIEALHAEPSTFCRCE